MKVAAAYTADQAMTLLPRLKRDHEIVPVALGFGAETVWHDRGTDYLVPADVIQKSKLKEIDLLARSFSIDWHSHPSIAEIFTYKTYSLSCLVEYNIALFFIKLLSLMAILEVWLQDGPVHLWLTKDGSGFRDLHEAMSGLQVESVSSPSARKGWGMKPLSHGAREFYATVKWRMKTKGSMACPESCTAIFHHYWPSRLSSLYPIEEICEMGENVLVIADNSILNGFHYRNAPVLRSLYSYLTPLEYLGSIKRARSWYNSAKRRFPQGVLDTALSYAGCTLWPSLISEVTNVRIRAMASLIPILDALAEMFTREKLGLLVLPSDANPILRSAAMVAESNGVPSLVIQHGVTMNEISYAPLYANHMAVWGSLSKNYMMSRGTESHRLIETGAVNMDKRSNPSGISKESLGSQLGISAEKKWIVVITTWVPNEMASQSLKDILHHLTAILDILGKDERYQLIVKMHPAEEPTYVKDIVTLYPGAVATKDYLPELLAVSDLVVTQCSGVGLEAMLCGRDVLMFDLTNDYFLLPYVDYGAAVGIRSAQELSAAVDRVFSDSSLRNELSRGRERLIADYLGDMDGRAAERLAEVITRLTHARVKEAGDHV